MKTLCAVNVEVLDEIDEILDIVRILVENSNIDKKKSMYNLKVFDKNFNKKAEAKIWKRIIINK